MHFVMVDQASERPIPNEQLAIPPPHNFEYVFDQADQVLPIALFTLRGKKLLNRKPPPPSTEMTDLTTNQDAAYQTNEEPSYPDPIQGHSTDYSAESQRHTPVWMPPTEGSYDLHTEIEESSIA